MTTTNTSTATSNNDIDSVEVLAKTFVAIIRSHEERIKALEFDVEQLLRAQKK